MICHTLVPQDFLDWFIRWAQILPFDCTLGVKYMLEYDLY